MQKLSLIVFALVAGLLAPVTSGAAADRVVFGTDWRAQAEHGGFYQALAKGFYKKRGLEVVIRQGGPQINHAQLLAAGRVDFSLSSNSFIVLNYAREKIPMVAVAALFQKDPQVLIAHPGQGNDSLAALEGKPIYIGADTRIGSWLFLKARFGFSDNQIRSYTFSIAPFLVRKSTIQQGYLGSEPYLMEGQGIKPVVHLLADSGYQSYGALIQTSRRLTEEKPALVRAFVAASIEGWRDYLGSDPDPGNALIKRHNPEMSEGLLAYGRAKMIEYGIVGSGDAGTNGIGAMTQRRWQAFFIMMSAAGLYPASMDWRRAFSTDFLPREKSSR
ncbi:MAG: ABC transporter substrate-binding protein [Rhodospirillaceae bacterium]|jgi:NitT/TauT family transport system substrate-binding protein|nr:ABC transporter substrate-binding protein [Rhodospirillaceae bacterium]MBT5459500.1 ABC transporter substrate-binding protein [Rhodospirillaceae bacterium]